MVINKNSMFLEPQEKETMQSNLHKAGVKSFTQLAKKLEISPQRLSNIVNGYVPLSKNYLQKFVDLGLLENGY